MSGPTIAWRGSGHGPWLVDIVLEDGSSATYRVPGTRHHIRGRAYLVLSRIDIAEPYDHARRDQIKAVISDLARIALEDRFGGESEVEA